MSTDVDGAPMLRAVATDGHRLARVELPAPQGAAGMPGVIVPRKAVSEIQKLIEDPAQEIVVELSTAKARFQFGDVVLTGVRRHVGEAVEDRQVAQRQRGFR